MHFSKRDQQPLMRVAVGIVCSALCCVVFALHCIVCCLSRGVSCGVCSALCCCVLLVRALRCVVCCSRGVVLVLCSCASRRVVFVPCVAHQHCHFVTKSVIVVTKFVIVVTKSVFLFTEFGICTSVHCMCIFCDQMCDCAIEFAIVRPNP